MPDFYERYQKGFHQEVNDELLAMQEQIYDPFFNDDALAVMREIMKRVRFNIELLLQRLRDLGYQFGKGFFEDISPERKYRSHGKSQKDKCI